MMQNNNFNGYSMLNIDNSQFFQNGINSYANNPYDLAFNRYQSSQISLSANQASSETMIMTLFQIIDNQAKSL